MDDCPASFFIPIYLVVCGIVAAVVSLVFVVQIIIMTRNPTCAVGTMLLMWYICEGVGGLFLTGWFIAGKCVYACSYVRNQALC